MAENTETGWQLGMNPDNVEEVSIFDPTGKEIAAVLPGVESLTIARRIVNILNAADKTRADYVDTMDHDTKAFVKNSITTIYALVDLIHFLYGDRNWELFRDDAPEMLTFRQWRHQTKPPFGTTEPYPAPR